MRILLVGAGGVGDAIAKIAAERDFFETMVVADYDVSKAERTVEWIRRKHGDAVAAKFVTGRIDASTADGVAEVCREFSITHVLNAVEPKFVPTVFSGAFTAGCHYLDMAMSLSEPHETDPYHQAGLKLGDQQYALNDQWERAGLLALVGIGVEPGLSNIFARYAVDYLFGEVDEISVKDGGNLVVRDDEGNEIFAPSFSIWTTIEECLNPPLMWEEGKGWYTTRAFSEPEVFEFPEGIGAVECVNVEHEEVLLVPRWIECERVTFKYGLGDEFIEVLKTLHKLGLDRTDAVDVRGGRVSPRDVVAACLPDPAMLGDRMSGKTCAGTWVTGTGKDGQRREVYLYHVADNEWTMREYGTQAVTWQTAMNPVIALELLASGTWSGAGVLGPEAFDAVPYLDLMSEGYGQSWHVREQG